MQDTQTYPGRQAGTADVASVAVKIRIPECYRVKFEDTAEEVDPGAVMWYWEVADVRQDHAGKYYRVRVPAATAPHPRYQVKLKFGTAERDPDQGAGEKTPELTGTEWATTKLLLGGTPDPTRGPAQRCRGADDDDPWLWEELIQRHGVSLLCGPPKGGKTTLLRGLLGAAAGREPAPLLGAAVQPFRAFVVTEEQRSCWYDVPGNFRLLHLDGATPRPAKAWDAFVEHAQSLARAHGCQLICFDTLAAAAGFDENSAKQVARAFAPLRRLAQWQSVLVIHHTTKYATGTAAVRGSSAITASADSVLTIECPGADESDPRRVLASVGRLAQPMRLEYVRLPDGSLDLTGPRKRGTRSILKGGG